MSVHLYKNFDILKIRFSDTIKKKIVKDSGNKQTDITMCHNNAPIFIQLDKCICSGVNNNCIILEIPKTVENFVKGIEEYIIDTLHEKSERWFNGKRFTMNKIQSGLVSCLANGKLTVMLNEDSIFFDQFKRKMTLDDLNYPLDCTCVVRLCCLQFIGNKYKYKISVEQCKVNIDYKLVEYSIIETKSERDSITPITRTESETSYRDYPEYYHSEVDSHGANFFK